MVEFQNKELKKRTRVISVFPNKEALLRPTSALLVELDDKWLSETKAHSDFFRWRNGNLQKKVYVA